MRLITVDGDDDRIGEDISPSQPDWANALETQAKGTQPFTADPSPRKFRLSGDEVELLERLFTQNPKPNDEIKRNLGKQFGVEASRITIWFQNRRAKEEQMRRTAELVAKPCNVDDLTSNLKLTITLHSTLDQSPAGSPGPFHQRHWWDLPGHSKGFNAKWQSPIRNAPSPRPLFDAREIGVWQRIDSSNDTAIPPVRAIHGQRLKTAYIRDDATCALVQLERVLTSRDYAVSCLSIAHLKKLGLSYAQMPMERVPNPKGGFFQPLGCTALLLYLPCARLFWIMVSILPELPSELEDSLVLGAPELARILEGERTLGRSLRA